MEIGNIEVFLEALTIASACNKVLRKKFLSPISLDYYRLENILPITDIARKP
jgi:hypothetical protein